jgi:hypothetical protein
MVGWTSLVVPALASAGLVFVASSFVHMVLRWHNADYKKLPNEDVVRDAIRSASPAPGQYILPHCTDPKQANDPAMIRKFEEGPVGVLYVRAPGRTKLGPFLISWFLYTLVVGLLAGYVAKIALPVGTSYGVVFRLTGTVAWIAYAWQGPADSIWKGKPWRVTVREMGDGLLYGCLTAGVFGWLWPR